MLKLTYVFISQRLSRYQTHISFIPKSLFNIKSYICFYIAEAQQLTNTRAF